MLFCWFSPHFFVFLYNLHWENITAYFLWLDEIQFWLFFSLLRVYKHFHLISCLYYISQIKFLSAIVWRKIVKYLFYKRISIFKFNLWCSYFFILLLQSCFSFCSYILPMFWCNVFLSIRIHLFKFSLICCETSKKFQLNL